MKTGRAAAALFATLFAAGIPSGLSAQREPASLSERYAHVLLSEHNRARNEAGVPPLAWNNRLAREAQDWAHQLALEGMIRHSNSRAGENLWMGSAGHFAPERMVGAFVEERQFYVHGTFPQVSRTGRWEDVGHYTQVVWRDTREVGCAVARGSGFDFLVCRYWPAGNWMGQAAF